MNLLFKVGKKQKAIEVAMTVANRANEVASYLIGEGKRSSYEVRKNLFMLGAMQRNLYENGEDVLAQHYENAYNALVARLNGQGTMQSSN